MSNCNKLFLEFSKTITPSFEEMQKMKNSRRALEKKITDKLKEKVGVTVKFFTQGSGAHRMRTIIIKENDTYDADRGIYLPKKPEVSADTIQKYVFEAVNGHTLGGAEHKKKCIRVYYKSAYNIDFPVYYEVQNEDYSYLAIKGNGWIKDDPWHMITWLEAHKDEGGQLIRIIKFLKVWASKCDCKMPSGIALAVWASRNFVVEQDRDDKCLLKVLKGIQVSVFQSVNCFSPVEPFDDLTAKLTENQKKRFKIELNDFVEGAQKAINEPNQLKSSEIWREYLGKRFPLGVDEEVDKKIKALLTSATTVLSQSAKLSNFGQINNSTGIHHKTHRNYGG